MWILKNLINLVLTAVDIVSDIMLAIDYCVVDVQWCGLTWAFIAGPLLTFCIIILFFWFRRNRGGNDSSNNGSLQTLPSVWMYWKATEVCFEAGPQLVLQLYITALTDQDASSTQESSLFGTIVRVITIVTSLLSLSIGFVTWRAYQEKEGKNTEWNWDWKDMAADMVWNVLSISSRVITMSLFASYEPYWFWGLIGGQILVVFLCVGHYGNKNVKDVGFLYHAFMSSFTAVGMVFNMFLAYTIHVPFPVYIFYWSLMFIENTVMITLWYQWSSNLGLWYHDVAISCLLIAYFLSLIIKTVHCYFYNDKNQNIFEWKFYYRPSTKKNKNKTTKDNTNVDNTTEDGGAEGETSID